MMKKEFFENMIIMKYSVGFIDWSRAAITDWILDFVTMDLHRPYFKIPEKLVPFFKQNGIEVLNFKERFFPFSRFYQKNCIRKQRRISFLLKKIRKSFSPSKNKLIYIRTIFPQFIYKSNKDY